VLGDALFFLREFIPARTYLEQALVFSATPQDRSLISPAGRIARVTTGTTAWVLWMLGYPDQALTRSHAMLAYARELQHAFGLVRTLNNVAILHKLRGETDATQGWAEAALASMTEQGFGRLLGATTFARGWAFAAQGRHEEGMAEMSQSLAARRAMGAGQSEAEYLARLTEEWLRLLAEALAVVDKGDLWYEAEQHRIQGELLLRQAIPDMPQAEACFQQALAVARRQQAKSWELRTAMSLARLWQQQGKHAAARQMLAEGYGWFTEGFDTPDLQEARALLDALA